MKITIIGAAGTLGSCAAFNIMVHNLADELVLIDPWENMLKSHSIDLNIAKTGTDLVIHTGKYEEMAGSDIVVITAGTSHGAMTEVVTTPAQFLRLNLPIIKENAQKINQYCPEAIIITETNPVDPLNYAMYLINKNRDRRKIIGYTFNDTLRFRMWVAEELGIKSSRVQAFTIGEHGPSQVMLFSTVTVDGKPVEFNSVSRNRIKDKYPAWMAMNQKLTPQRTLGWTSSVGTIAIITAIKHDTRELIPCNMVLQGEYGYSNLSMTVPTVIGKDGIMEVKELSLPALEKEELNYTVSLLNPRMRFVEEYLGTGAK